MKRLLAICLALVMCLGMAVTASAEDEGIITITNATVGETYIAYKIFDADPSSTSDAIAYTATEGQMKYWTEDMAESNPFTFTLNHMGSYNVGVNDDYKNNDKRVTDILNGIFYRTEVDSASGTSKKVLNAERISQLKTEGIISEQASGTATESSSNPGKVSFSVPYGYYLITSSLGSIVTVNSTQPNVDVIDKNQSGPNWPEDGGKVFLNDSGAIIVDDDDAPVKSVSAKIGDTLKFRVRLDATNYVGEEFIKTYFIKDTLGAGMSYVSTGNNNEVITKNDIVVKVGNTTLRENQYELSATNNSDGTTGFVVKIAWATYSTDTQSKVDTLGSFNFPGATNTIVVEYSATVNDNAVMAGSGNLNNAQYAYNTGANGTPTPEEPGYDETNKSTTTTYTYALGIQKVDGKQEALSGAEFVVSYQDTANETQYIVVKKDDDGKLVTDEKGNYIYARSTEDLTEASELTTNSDGQIVIKGVGDTTYKVTETKAPAGYNKLDKDITVKASLVEVASYTENVTTYFDKDGNVVDQETQGGVTKDYKFPVNVTSATVVNKTGNLLPSTGGIGTTIFYVVGGLLVAGAGVLLITKKRMKKEQ